MGCLICEKGWDVYISSGQTHEHVYSSVWTCVKFEVRVPGLESGCLLGHHLCRFFGYMSGGNCSNIMYIHDFFVHLGVVAWIFLVLVIYIEQIHTLIGFNIFDAINALNLDIQWNLNIKTTQWTSARWSYLWGGLITESVQHYKCVFVTKKVVLMDEVVLSQGWC